MDNKPPRKNNDPVPIFHPADQSIPHHDLGMVQPGATASMEPHFSPNFGEPRFRLSSADKPNMARMGKPPVEIPNGQSVSSRREDNRLESTITNFARSSFARIKPFARIQAEGVELELAELGKQLISDQ